MAAAGLSAPEAWRAYGSPDLQGGEAAMAVLRENAISLLQQFSLVGFDNITIATYTSPKLTTVRYPIVPLSLWQRWQQNYPSGEQLDYWNHKPPIYSCQHWFAATPLPSAPK